MVHDIYRQDEDKEIRHIIKVHEIHTYIVFLSKHGEYCTEEGNDCEHIFLIRKRGSKLHRNKIVKWKGKGATVNVGNKVWIWIERVNAKIII